jgi:hypothetical protein
MKPVSAESQVPGDFYLCQVGENVSCAACCGLYNAEDCTYAGLHRMLSDRSRQFALLPRSADTIAEFGRQVEWSQLRSRPWSDFHHCPFVGLIGDNRQRVGCLLHPLADGNKGVDYRGLSYYGGMACRQYFCPSHRDLAPAIKQILRHLAGNWYEYGLVITETVLLKALVSEIEKKIAAPLSADAVLDNPAAIRALREVLFLKIDWPYRQGGGKALCHYFFADRRYRRQPVDYSSAGRHPVGFEKIFAELTSGFQNSDELQRAERRLESLLQLAANAVRSRSL